MENRICIKCGKEKPLSHFYKRRDRGENCYYTFCIECSNHKSNKRRLDDLERYRSYDRDYKYKNKEKHRDANTKFKNKNIHKFRATQIIRRHKKRGFVVNISVEELEVMLSNSSHCPICGVKYVLEYGNGKHMKVPSLDRKDNEQILTTKNTWIICMKCNVTKGDRTMQEFKEYCKIVSEKEFE